MSMGLLHSFPSTSQADSNYSPIFSLASSIISVMQRSIKICEGTLFSIFWFKVSFWAASLFQTSLSTNCCNLSFNST